MTPPRRPLPVEAPVRYRPVSGRRRLLILLLAVGTAIVIVTTMLDPMARLKGSQQQAASAASAQRAATPPICTAGQDTGCLGGKAEVILLAPAPAGSAAR
jgi:hypothetical protein